MNGSVPFKVDGSALLAEVCVSMEASEFAREIYFFLLISTTSLNFCSSSLVFINVVSLCDLRTFALFRCFRLFNSPGGFQDA